ncbi:MAG: epoxyqueuosine reductase QueH [Candidatus Omnitrophica bacterium]|nr:epoxyqueuosine reductase QueH [Candidatus Omnitrophota bacterium]
MKVLLHTCCAPCLIYPMQRLRENGFQVSGFYYNPNIHPYSEHEKRKQAVENIAEESNIKVIYPEYNPKDFFQVTSLIEERLERCPVCWYLRMKKTGREAKERGFDYFSTTLLVSPYQDQEALSRIGKEIAEEENLKFYYEDFRPGFRKAQDLAKSKGIYTQKYCGCIYSEIERCRDSQKQ